MSLKRKAADEEAPAQPDNVFRSSRVEDRQSTFIGLFSPILKPKELQSLQEIESASHKMIGWRKQSNQQSISKATQYVTGSDDDGEKYGGKKIEKVLGESKVVGSCVVARWYGGVMLGPVRFTHIEEVAKEAVQKWQEHEAEVTNKKRKLEEDTMEHIRLSTSIAERDQSIVVLRGLAAKKEQELKDRRQGAQKEEDEDKRQPATSSQGSASNLQATVDYFAMPLERLRALDKGRDATLSFLLKRIDKAEAELVQYQKSVSEEPP